MRAALELLVTAVEKVQRDEELGDAYAIEAEERSDEREFTQAATRAAARRWRE